MTIAGQPPSADGIARVMGDRALLAQVALAVHEFDFEGALKALGRALVGEPG